MPISARSDGDGIALALQGVAVTYPGLPAPVLAIGNLSIAAGERVAVTGASGSGKTTFLNVVTGLERPGTGSVRWAGTDIARLSEAARDRWRAANVGLVMQDFHLFAGLSAVDNVLLPARLTVGADTALKERAHALLDRVGLSKHAQAVETMSRGEMQRVAVARALLRRPAVIVGDEPTASLDPDSAAAVADLLLELAGEEAATLIVATHDERLIARMPRVLRLVAGRPEGGARAGIAA